MALPAVFSIGHSTHDVAGLVRLLRMHGVEHVIDVRRYPASRRSPWFNKEALARELGREDIAYRHLPELGGRRRPSPTSPNAGWRVEGFRGYADHMAGAEFARGLEVLEGAARDRPTATMCAEGLWWRCHRRLISDALAVRGWQVTHIGPDGKTSPHEVPSFAVVEGRTLTYPPLQTSLDSG